MIAADEDIRRLLLAGHSRREIAGLVKASPMRVRALADTMKLPACGCGQRHGHRGWCAYRLARSPRRQQFLKDELPQRNKIVTQKGVAKSAEHRAAIHAAHLGIPKHGTPEEIAEAKAQPLSVRRWYQRARLALAGAVSLDRTLEAGDELADFLFLQLVQPEPTPLQRLIEKEEHDLWEKQERRFWLWERETAAQIRLERRRERTREWKSPRVLQDGA